MKAYVAGIAGAILLSVTLAGCVPSTVAAPSPKAPLTSSAKATAKPIADGPIPGDFDGDGKVTSWDLEQTAKSVYTMPDGTAIPIPSDQPLPAVVVEAVKTTIMPTAVAFETSSYGASMAEHDAAFAADLKVKGDAINRTIIAVSYIRANGAWGVSDAAGATAGQTKAQAVDYANAFAARDLDRYVVMVFGQ